MRYKVYQKKNFCMKIRDKLCDDNFNISFQSYVTFYRNKCTQLGISFFSDFVYIYIYNGDIFQFSFTLSMRTLNMTFKKNFRNL